MIYSDKERLGISVLLSLILCISLFLLFDLLIEMNFLTPKVIRPPLIVSFYEETPAPLREEKKEEIQEAPSQPEESSVARKEPPREQPTVKESASSPRASRTAEPRTQPQSSGAPQTSDAPAPVSWGDEPADNKPFVPIAENLIEYDDDGGTPGPSDSAQPVPEVELVRDTSQYDKKLARISDKSVSESSSSSSTADLDGTNPSPISSTSPKSLDEITDIRELKSQPLPKRPPGSLHGRTELYIEVDFDVTWAGIITNLQFRNETGYHELEQAIRNALENWLFEAAPRDTPNIRVRTGFNFRAR